MEIEEKHSLKTLFFELTPRCNQKCIYCYNPWREDNGRRIEEPDSEAIYQLLGSVMAQVRVQTLVLTGGEPFLRADIFQIIHRVNQQGVSVAVISNGGLIDADTAQMLSRRNVKFVQITLAGADDHTHDALCGPGTFRKAKKALRMLQHFGVKTGGSYLCTAHNYQQAGAVFELFHTLQVKQIAFNRFNPSGAPQRINMSLLPTRSQVFQALTQANDKGAEHNLKIFNTMPIPPCAMDYAQFPNIKFSQCSAGLAGGQLALRPDGNVFLCTLQKNSIGSMRHGSLDAILKSVPLNSFRQQLPEFCIACGHGSKCLGGCGAAAQWVFGSAKDVDPFLAQHIMPDYSERIKLLTSKNQASNQASDP